MREDRDQYLTVEREGAHETEISRSRFLCSLAPAGDEDEALAFVARIRAEHPTASHHCYAYVLGADSSTRKASDDGEPGGTAGVPMLHMLTRRGVTGVVAVVTRYFGGTKLGAGGLIRAYGGVVGEALDALGTVARRRYRRLTVVTDHQRAGRLENELRGGAYPVLDVRYGAEVALEVGVPEAELDAFRARVADATAGSARVDVGGELYHPA
ncbi:YigZ family protein [Streptomyces sp. AJS327]|uniref:YigZ family protein n=1 Tax=Streptomyces sp. AJS327 TaxID=2545265 RepID=UPI0015E02523|nr:YigZ family protein [Streptomyces sp. AJS327]MBA0051145.1 YigZ family protein [Streptomyces sp. AJS327]